MRTARAPIVELDDRGSPPQIVSLSIGAAAWASLYLRLGGVRGLIPLNFRD